jgi:hypothetical protein
MAGEKSWAEQSWAERIGGVIGVLLALIGTGWGIWWCAGCGKNGDPQQPPAPQKSKFDLEPSPKSETPDDPEASGPLVDARERAKRFEKKRAALQPLLGKALADRDELVGKLREAGVEKSADLKGNSRGQQLAGALQRLTVEIDGLERSIAAIDKAIVEAQSVVRRLERERAGISDEEMRKLAEQLREAEERTDGAARTPVTPLDVEAALDKALKGTRNTQPSQSSTAQADKRLVGKWEIVEGEQKGTATFTDGGTVFFTWFRRDIKRNLNETGKYSLAGKSLKIKASGEYDGESVREIEFLTDDELLVHRPKGFNFTWLYGRLKRVK